MGCKRKGQRSAPRADDAGDGFWWKLLFKMQLENESGVSDITFHNSRRCQALRDKHRAWRKPAAAPFSGPGLRAGPVCVNGV